MIVIFEKLHFGCNAIYFIWLFLGIKRRSKVPGVMITQYVEELPEGKSTPDFTRKPIALTIQEGQDIGKLKYSYIHEIQYYSPQSPPGKTEEK